MNIIEKDKDKNDLSDIKQITDKLINCSSNKNTSKAYQNDLRVFWGWAHLRYGVNTHYPVNHDLLLAFVVHHSIKPEKTIDKKMVELGIRSKSGPYKISTLRRIINTLGREHTVKNVHNSTKSPQLKLLLRNLGNHMPELKKESKKALTVDIIIAMGQTCKDSLVDKRDLALLYTMFGSGGRRRCEIVKLQYEDIETKDDGFLLTFRCTKNREDITVPLQGKAAKALKIWLSVSGIKTGNVFRSIIGKNKIGPALNDRWVYQIIKKRLKKAGINPDGYSAHSVRAGFVTSCAQAGISMAETMKMSAHKTYQVALDYYRPGALVVSPTTLIME